MMNKLISLAKLAFFLCSICLFTISCSDDDNATPVKKPSTVVTKVRIYKSTAKTELLTVLLFTYDSNNRLTQIYSASPLTTVNYVYSKDSKVSYNYASENSTLVEMKTTLENGRSYMCTFSNKENAATYSYDNQGYLGLCNNNGVVLEYSWNNGNLKSISTNPRGTYNSEFRTTNIANNYSIDLNTLAQLVDDRTDYIGVMNSYGQIAGFLGKRSANLIEDTYYTYDYSFYQEGRLKDLTLLNSSAEGFTFRIEYADNILE